MDKAINVIRSELLALKSCLAKIKALKDAVREAKDAQVVKSSVKEVNDALLALSDAANEKEKFLKERKQANMKVYLEAQELSDKRDVSLRLLIKAGELEGELFEETNTAKELLKRSAAFIDYRVNVLTGAKADVTYGGKNSGDAKKMFDANV